MKRSLCQCYHAHGLGDKIYCAKGHRLGGNFSPDGTIKYLRLARGRPLELTVCKACPDFDSMGDPVLPEDRGWIKVKKGGI